MVTLALLFQTMTTKDPFFTNDGIGLIKVFGFLAAIVAPLATVIYKISHGRVSDDVKGVKDDVDGIGKKVNSHTDEITALRSSVATLKEVQSSCTHDIGYLREGQGSLGSALKQVAEANANVQKDITTLITQTSAQHTEALHRLELEFTRLQTTMKVRDELAVELERRFAITGGKGDGR